MYIPDDESPLKEMKDENRSIALARASPGTASEGEIVAASSSTSTMAPTAIISASSSSAKASGKTSAASKKTIPKKRGREKKPKGYPSRPLSAYNFFFKLARDRLVEGHETMVFTQKEVDNAPSGPAIDPKKRLHRKTHGKVGFKELAFRVGALWKTLDPMYKSMFNRRAEVEREKYDVALHHWKKTNQNKQVGKGIDKDTTPPMDHIIVDFGQPDRTALSRTASSPFFADDGENSDEWDDLLARVHDTPDNAHDEDIAMLNPSSQLVSSNPMSDEEFTNILSMTKAMTDDVSLSKTTEDSQYCDSLYSMLTCNGNETSSSSLSSLDNKTTQLLEILEPRPIGPNASVSGASPHFQPALFSSAVYNQRQSNMMLPGTPMQSMTGALPSPLSSTGMSSLSMYGNPVNASLPGVHIMMPQQQAQQPFFPYAAQPQVVFPPLPLSNAPNYIFASSLPANQQPFGSNASSSNMSGTAMTNPLHPPTARAPGYNSHGFPQN